MSNRQTRRAMGIRRKRPEERRRTKAREMAEGMFARELPQRRDEWVKAHPSRLPREVLGVSRFVDEWDQRNPGPKRVVWLGTCSHCHAPPERTKPSYEVAFDVRVAVPQFEQLRDPNFMQHMQERAVKRFRTVPWACGNRDNEVRWFSWEMIGEDTPEEKQSWPRMREAYHYLRRAMHVLNETGLACAKGYQLGTSPYHGWAHKELGEALEVALLEVGAWLGEPLSEQPLPGGGVAKSWTAF